MSGNAVPKRNAQTVQQIARRSASRDPRRAVGRLYIGVDAML